MQTVIMQPVFRFCCIPAAFQRRSLKVLLFLGVNVGRKRGGTLLSSPVAAHLLLKKQP